MIWLDLGNPESGPIISGIVASRRTRTRPLVLFWARSDECILCWWSERACVAAHAALKAGPVRGSRCNAALAKNVVAEARDISFFMQIVVISRLLLSSSRSSSPSLSRRLLRFGKSRKQETTNSCRWTSVKAACVSSVKGVHEMVGSHRGALDVRAAAG